VSAASPGGGQPGGAACDVTRSLQIAGSWPPPWRPRGGGADDGGAGGGGWHNEPLRFYGALLYETPWCAEASPRAYFSTAGIE